MNKQKRGTINTGRLAGPLADAQCDIGGDNNEDRCYYPEYHPAGQRRDARKVNKQQQSISGGRKAVLRRYLDRARIRAASASGYRRRTEPFKRSLYQTYTHVNGWLEFVLLDENGDPYIKPQESQHLIDKGPDPKHRDPYSWYLTYAFPSKMGTLRYHYLGEIMMQQAIELMKKAIRTIARTTDAQLSVLRVVREEEWTSIFNYLSDPALSTTLFSPITQWNTELLLFGNLPNTRPKNNLFAPTDDWLRNARNSVIQSLPTRFA